MIQTKGTSYNFVTNGGWCADYFDPFDYLNVLFDGSKIQAANNNNYAYFNNCVVQRRSRSRFLALRLQLAPRRTRSSIRP